MRLIDAEELKHRVNNSKYYGTERQRDFCDMIAESETIDAVKVVRCKDCVYWHSGDMGTGEVYEPYCEMLDTETDESAFCSDGERRE